VARATDLMHRCGRRLPRHKRTGEARTHGNSSDRVLVAPFRDSLAAMLDQASGSSKRSDVSSHSFLPKNAAPHRSPAPQGPAAAMLTRPQVIQRMSESGAGEGIRTLDPNLGKVVLYP
jgi:hypothetical protein